ncbi:hypothetical protein ACHAQI_011350 [Fusarium lateritium]
MSVASNALRHEHIIDELNDAWNGEAWLPEDIRRLQKGSSGGRVRQTPPIGVCRPLNDITKLAMTKGLSQQQLHSLWRPGGHLRQALAGKTGPRSNGSLTEKIAKEILTDIRNLPEQAWLAIKAQATTSNVPIPVALPNPLPSSQPRGQSFVPIRPAPANTNLTIPTASTNQKQPTNQRQSANHRPIAPRPISPPTNKPSSADRLNVEEVRMQLTGTKAITARVVHFACKALAAYATHSCTGIDRVWVAAPE